MMGSQGAGQAPLFYAFNLEDHVPRDHLLRAYFSPSWMAFQAERGRHFSVIVDGVSN
jgi:hypothetical protein